MKSGGSGEVGGGTTVKGDTAGVRNARGMLERKKWQRE